MSVIMVYRPTYYSARRCRHFMTVKGAAVAEANARMKHWFPTEKAERDSLGETYPGWHFNQDPRLVAIRDRLVRRYVEKLKRLSR